YEISKRENFYQQEYCGCVYSLRDTNLWRIQKGRPRIERGVKHYEFDATKPLPDTDGADNPRS
ncbi:MAG: epoxyqueuosine reductase QueH, partial [Candidatus Omnitrophica bacterium]|nr:epoxyqueuosine reductase QueH [Candidatus Omnitrophota bacterium]